MTPSAAFPLIFSLLGLFAEIAYELHMRDMKGLSFNVTSQSLCHYSKCPTRHNDFRHLLQKSYQSSYNVVIQDVKEIKTNKLKVFFRMPFQKIFSNDTTIRFIDLSKDWLTEREKDVFVFIKIMFPWNCVNQHPMAKSLKPSINLPLIKIQLKCEVKTFQNTKWEFFIFLCIVINQKSVNMTGATVYICSQSFPSLEIAETSKIRIPASFPRYYVTTNTKLCNFSKGNLIEINKPLNHEECRNHSKKQMSIIVRKRRSWPVSVMLQTYATNNIENCPKVCECSQLNKQIIVDCSARNLQKIPEVLPPETNTIFLQNNSIELLRMHDQAWLNVAHLYISNNFLRTIEILTFPESLTTLYVDNNKLTILPITIMMKVKLTENFTIRLAFNEWKCGCQSSFLFKWMYENVEKIKDYDDITCSNHSAENNSAGAVHIMKMSLAKCSEKHVPFIRTKAAFFMIFPFMFLIIGISYFVYVYRRTVLALIYVFRLHYLAQKGEPYEMSKLPIFVWCNITDSEKVDILICNLESKYEFSSYVQDNLLSHEFHGIWASVRKNVATLLLVSENFTQNNWFRLQFPMVFEQMSESLRKKIIPIFLGDINYEASLPWKLRELWYENLQLKWKDRLFWIKLQYVLRPKKLCVYLPTNKPLDTEV